MTGKPRGHEWDAKAWLGDEALSGCSFEARAVWADMISLMLLCPQVGVLASADGTPWSDERIVAAVRGDKAVAAAALAELLRHGVASRTKHSGAVYSRRLVRLEAARKSRRSRDPSCRHVVAIPSKRGTRGGAMSGLDLLSKHQHDIPFKTKAFEAALIRWLEHKTERHETYKTTGFLGLLKRLAGMGEQRAIDAIAFSILRPRRPRRADQIREHVPAAGDRRPLPGPQADVCDAKRIQPR